MTEPTETADEEAPVEIDVETGETTEPGVEPEASEPDAGPRAVAFETATEALATAFDIDARTGETITDLETTETEEGRQVVATVETSRSTMLSHRLAGAKRTGRRVGIRVALLGVFAAIAYVALAGRRLLGGNDPDDVPVDELPDEAFEAE